MNAYAPARSRWQRGLTLFELLIAAALLAVLVAIAVPSYRQYTLRAQRTEAKVELLRIAAQQERFYVQNGNRFTADLTALGYAVPAGAPTPGNRYLISIDQDAGADGFTARATAGPAMAGDIRCREFSINAQGERRAAPDPDGMCW